jgi:hypothetical protein
MIGTLFLQAAKQECDTGTLGFQGLTYLRQFTGIMLSLIGFLFGLICRVLCTRSLFQREVEDNSLVTITLP